ncbi:MAG: ornithine carbamoyltransferase [Eubacteriales bacterium]|nr:ornithine carbamoyltransferase [Eubacteriales bacterium]
MKHLLSLNDLTPEQILDLLDLADRLKADTKAKRSHPILAGKTLGMIFAKSSTRTRVSFEVGMVQLGGHALFLSSNDIQLGRGESIEDTAKVMSRFIDGIMIRTFAHQDVIDLARFGTIPIINGLTDLLHPCQVLADLQTIREHKGQLQGLKMAYLGDGNNMANSLLHGAAKVGMDIAVATPPGYTCDPESIREAEAAAVLSGSKVLITTDPLIAMQDADVVVTDTWVSMGQEAEKAVKVALFGDYQVNAQRMTLAKPDAIFLHCLPAYRGYEVTAEIIDGPQSVIFDEAENRLHAQKAVLVRLLAPDYQG